MSASGIEAQIAEALLIRLAALSLSPALQVAWPNKKFPETGDTKPATYLKASLLRAPTQGVGISAWDEHAGLLQVDVIYKAQDGEIKPLDIADQVAAWFPRGTPLVNGSVQVGVYEQPSIATAVREDDSYNKFPVSIRYRTFTR